MKSMIEIVYKENKEQANGNEGYFHLPKNIRQVGDTNGRERIYLEDYVGTFLKKYFSAPEGRAAMLFGEFKWADGISYFFIRSAAAIHTMEPAPDHLVFDDAVWTEVHDVMEKYFKNQQILGWALSLPGYGEDLNEQIIRAHLNHFGGNDKTLFRVNGQEKEETFYTYEGGTLRSTGGFYIYYEKNEPMQSYLIDQNQNRSIENGESVPDRAVSDFRKMIEEKSGEQTGAAENNTGTVQTDPAPGAEPSSAPGTASGSETAETAAQVWQEYTVQKGDSLSKISERYYGTMSRVKDICELNQIAVEDLIYAGQKIYLPK